MSLDLQATEAVRRRMQRTARKDNPFERTVRSQLYARKLRYRIHYPIPGMKRTTCDFAFPGMKIAVFLDGCFWHGCEVHPPSVKKNTDFWLSKIARNRTRDACATAHLTELGWTVLRFWEHETVATIADKISATVEAKKMSASPHRGARTLEDVQRPPG
ncbi:very short patch repair endonuclease [Rhizobium rosettiformans]|uniref:Very short patch repair endonuclease n=2 Tax=Rhizobium rosettiformans TaxID=1368430 RepID=A0A4S8PA86_9HYPH|nr:very short patch repair endonuclease [Rhizobium rosettiformans]THV27188.1 very short patch repair endonuclease [Rhizobium rosettiformans W3]